MNKSSHTWNAPDDYEVIDYEDTRALIQERALEFYNRLNIKDLNRCNELTEKQPININK
jgi:hypothetical protein